MKFSRVLLLAAVALMSLALVAATEREVRSYTSDMEYVDHVDLSAHASDLPVAMAGDHAMMETGSGSGSEEQQGLGADEHGMHFSMEDESAADAFGLDSFLESESASEEVSTEAMRAMALEIHDAAQAIVDDDGNVLMEVDSEAEAESEMESEAEMEAESEAEMESEAEAESELDPNAGLTPAEIAQEKADNLAAIKDKLAEKADAVEEKIEKKEAAKDAVILATPMPKIPAAAPSSAKDIVQLPADLSAEHAETLRANEVASKTIGTALKEVSAILSSKDDTIRSLVYNISYLTVGIGKLANKVDAQRSYIGLLKNKLRLSKAKVQQLKQHVKHSKETARSIRSELKSVEARLNKQDAKTTEVSNYLKNNQDKIRLPHLADDLEIRGAPVTKRKARPSGVQQIRKAVNTRLRPVAGTQTYADSQYIPAQPRFFPSPFFQGQIPVDVTPIAAAAQSYNVPSFDGIPTIVVEMNDDGQ